MRRGGLLFWGKKGGSRGNEGRRRVIKGLEGGEIPQPRKRKPEAIPPSGALTKIFNQIQRKKLPLQKDCLTRKKGRGGNLIKLRRK